MQLDRALDQEDAERTLRRFDRTHAAYLRQFYGVDIHDSGLYHVVLDSTVIELQACVELIARAAHSRGISRQIARGWTDRQE
jgi:cytidylate kinase